MSRRIRKIESRPDHKFKEGDYVREKDSNDDTWYEVIELSYRGFSGRWQYTLLEINPNEERETKHPTLRFHEDHHELAPICPNCEEYHPHDVSDEYDDKNRHYRCETRHCDVDVFEVEPAETITYNDDSDGCENKSDAAKRIGADDDIVSIVAEQVMGIPRGNGNSADEAGDGYD